ncbi:MAG: hypothetical protein K0R63_1607 [Rickettsiales bacterium]|jgi:YfiH family protein|nr:hypothetical protein [Rickettsiales bacterium]
MTHSPSPLTCDWLARHDGVRHGFFTRQGGVSEGIYASLNAGAGSNDNQIHVRENKKRIAESLGVPALQLCTLYQIHSPTVWEVTEPFEEERRPEADAMVTTTKGIALGILTADCVPVLFSCSRRSVIGAAHAGWKGAVSGVLENTVQAMERLGAKRNSIHATVGPCIHQESYEVGGEFIERLMDMDLQNERFFIPSDKPDHAMFDLPGYVLARLKGMGLHSVNQIPYDTCKEEAMFFSYRRKTLREETDYGRQVSAIVLV